MRVLIALTVVVICTGLVRGGDNDVDLYNEYRETKMQMLKEELKVQQDALRTAQKNRDKDGYATALVSIKTVQEELTGWKTQKNYAPLTPDDYICEGLVFKFTNSNFNQGNVQFRVLQVLDAETALVVHDRPGRQSSMCYFLKMSTKGLVSEKMLDMNGVFHCLGTETYDTVSGSSKTVHVVEPLRLKK